MPGGGGNTGGGTSAAKTELLDFFTNTSLPDWEEIKLSWKFLTQLRNFVLSSDWDSLPNSDSLAEELLAYLGETFYPELSGCVAKKPGMDLAYLLPEDTRTVLEGLNGFLEFFEIQFVTEGFTSYALLSLDGETEYLRTEDGLLFDNLLPPEARDKKRLRGVLGGRAVLSGYLGGKKFSQLYLGGSPLIR